MSKYNGFPTNQEAKRIYNFCAVTQPYNIFGCCLGDLPNRTPPIPSPGKMKTVFLLELSQGLVSATDIVFKNTLNYYWDTYPQEFTRCPIVDTKGLLETNLSLLDEYYNLGYRNFVGFTSSNILIGVLNWFNLHPDAKGITDFGNAEIASVPKNIYRIRPSNKYRIESINEQINYAISNGGNIYYIYQDGLLICEEIKTILINTVPSDQLKNYPATNQNLTVDNMNAFLSGYPVNSIIILILNVSRSTYINLYAGSLTFDEEQYDIGGNAAPNIPSGTISEKLSGKYNITSFKGVNSSILWRNGYNTLGNTNYDPVALNILNLLNQFSNNEYVGNINSHYGALIFDPVTKDLSYPNILLQQYNGTTFINTNLYVDDPYLGIYTAEFTGSSTTPTDIIPISPNKPFKGKAIALLELTNSVTQNDIIFNDSLYYYWYEDLTLPKFPIIDTAGADTINDLLDTYYNQGYRIFFGMTRSNVLLNSLSWFTNHPNAIGISLLSAATLPSVPKNIFRLNYSDSSYIQLLRSFFLDPAETIFYIYKEGNAQGEAIYNAFNYLYSDKLKTLIIDVDETNLNASTLNTFFDGNTANDIIFIYLQGIQSYIDVYDDPTMLPTLSKQYNAAVQADPEISATAGPKLNLIYFNIYPTYPNTSFLWNENRQYLTEKYGLSVNSFTLLNAITMIDYILLGKDINLLGSHSGVLQFSETTRNLIYISLLFKQYQYGSQTFVNYNISFQDPVLGTFIANFI
jgi:hypothetical protein